MTRFVLLRRSIDSLYSRSRRLTRRLANTCISFIACLSPFFSAAEMELVFIEMHELIDFTNEMHFNPAGVGIVDCAVPPLIQVEVCVQFAVDALQQI